MERHLLLESYLKRLRLPAVSRSYLAVAREAAERNQNYVEFLLALVEQEIINREEQSLRRRLRNARFPFVKGLEDYDFTLMPSLNKNKLLALSQGEFIARKETVIFVGNCGRAKPTWPLP